MIRDHQAVLPVVEGCSILPAGLEYKTGTTWMQQSTDCNRLVFKIILVLSTMLSLFQIFHLYIGQSTHLILAKPLGDLWMVHVLRYKQAPAELEDDATRKC